MICKLKTCVYIYTYIYVQKKHTYIYIYYTYLGSFITGRQGASLKKSWPVCPMFLGGFERFTDERLARLLQAGEAPASWGWGSTSRGESTLSTHWSWEMDLKNICFLLKTSSHVRLARPVLLKRGMFLWAGGGCDSALSFMLSRAMSGAWKSVCIEQASWPAK